MGILRIFLAVCVLIYHVGNPMMQKFLINGQLAVQCFFIISGFYMTLILKEKYKSDDNLIFLSNRALRLYPLYWVTLVLSFTYVLISPLLGVDNLYYRTYSSIFNAADFFDYKILFAATVLNILIFGQDFSKFIAVDFASNSVILTKSWATYSPSTSDFMINVPAWTIGVEMMFYLIAPFIVRKNPVIVVLLIVSSLLIRLSLYKFELFKDPFSYRFFPSELALFLLGFVSYTVYTKVKNENMHSMGSVLLLVIIFFVTFFGVIPGASLIKSIFLFLIVTLSIPVIFNHFKAKVFDRYLGELSYPIYISHWIVLVIARDFGVLSGGNNSIQSIIAFCLTVLLVSWGLHEFIGKRIERLRSRRFLQKSSKY